jgi:hypothetical protein
MTFPRTVRLTEPCARYANIKRMFDSDPQGMESCLQTTRNKALERCVS